MQVITGLGNASNILYTAQKRLIRPVLAQTQGFPHPAVLDPSLRNTDGSVRPPLATDSYNTTAGQGLVPLTRSAAAFTSAGSLIPGLVMSEALATSSGDAPYVAVHNGGNYAASGNPAQPMGLLGQWVGGTFDNVGQLSQVSVWQGPDSEYELLAPAWNDTTVAASVAAAATGQQVLLYPGADGRLTSTAGNQIAVARVISRPSSARLVIQLLI